MSQERQDRQLWQFDYGAIIHDLSKEAHASGNQQWVADISRAFSEIHELAEARPNRSFPISDESIRELAIKMRAIAARHRAHQISGHAQVQVPKFRAEVTFKPAHSPAKLVLPPGLWVSRIAEAFLGAVRFNRFVRPAIADMHDQYFEALKRGDKWAARLAIARGYAYLVPGWAWALGAAAVAKCAAWLLQR